MIARKHIIAAIEAAPRELEFKRYYIRATYYRNSKSGKNSGVKIIWWIK